MPWNISPALFIDYNLFCFRIWAVPASSINYRTARSFATSAAWPRTHLTSRYIHRPSKTCQSRPSSNTQNYWENRHERSQTSGVWNLKTPHDSNWTTIVPVASTTKNKKSFPLVISSVRWVRVVLNVCYPRPSAPTTNWSQSKTPCWPSATLITHGWDDGLCKTGKVPRPRSHHLNKQRSNKERITMLKRGLQRSVHRIKYT